MPRGQMVGNVLDLVPVRGALASRLDNLDGRGDVHQAGGDLPGVGLAGLVAVGDDYHDRVPEEFRVRLAPLAGPAGVTRRGHARTLKRVHVLLAFADVDNLAVTDRLDDFRAAGPGCASWSLGCPASRSWRWRQGRAG